MSIAGIVFVMCSMFKLSQTILLFTASKAPPPRNLLLMPNLRSHLNTLKLSLINSEFETSFDNHVSVRPTMSVSMLYEFRRQSETLVLRPLTF
uniref:Putative secreted protein n=1 Tax=Xenopsylla cheopis TaxID=163159 RepID=A0A6M2DVQ4_XENCH